MWKVQSINNVQSVNFGYRKTMAVVIWLVDAHMNFVTSVVVSMENVIVRMNMKIIMVVDLQTKGKIMMICNKEATILNRKWIPPLFIIQMMTNNIIIHLIWRALVNRIEKNGQNKIKPSNTKWCRVYIYLIGYSFFHKIKL